MSPHLQPVIWILRIGIACTFIGHGIFAFYVNPPWISYLMTVGFSASMAEQIMPVIGVIDFLVGLVVLVKPFRFVVLYAFLWAFATALIRPLSGESVWMFVERGSNFMAPLALYYLLYPSHPNHRISIIKSMSG